MNRVTLFFGVLTLVLASGLWSSISHAHFFPNQLESLFWKLVQPVGRPFSPVAGDFNEDGHADLAVPNSTRRDITVLLGAGDGTFSQQFCFMVGSGPRSIDTGDFDGDGHIDLAVANSGDPGFGGPSDVVAILSGNGDGTFGPAACYGVGSRPTSVIVGDFNVDGKPDVAAANFDSNDVSLLLGTGIPGPGLLKVTSPVTPSPSIISNSCLGISFLF